MSGFINQLLDNIPGDEAQQTKALRQVADIARHLWKTKPGSADLDLLAQRVGDAARDESSRIPLGESGLLEFFCSVLSTQGVRSTLIVQCLRIIGNSSADKDENRARVVATGCLPSIVSLLNDDSILAFVIPVLFNISVDYEPAQKAIYQAGINPELVSLISGPRLESSDALVNYVCKLLSFVATQEPEANLIHPATPFVLLSLADNRPLPLDANDFLSQASVALTYLAQEQYQQTFLETTGSISLILRAFSTACTVLDAPLDSPDDETQLRQVQTAFTATLADISAQPLFASSCSLDGSEVQTLQDWISAPHIALQSAACLALGNLARSDEKCSYLVQQRGVHKPLIAILSDCENVDAGLLHSVLGFLKNLAIVAGNKPILGDAGLFETEVLPRIWDLDTQIQVQFDAVSLTRLLLVGCTANVRRICAPLCENVVASTQPRSKLHSLMELSARSDQERTQMEAARAIATVCRVLHLSPELAPAPQSKLTAGSSPPFAPASDSPISSTTTTLPSRSKIMAGNRADPHLHLEIFYANHSAIADAMLRLSLQEKFPVLRSEMFFVFALMARTPEGAAAVVRAIHRPEAVAVVEAIVAGEPTPAATDTQAEPLPPSSSDIEEVASLEAQAPISANVATAMGACKTILDVDRENALVLVAELLRRCPDELPAAARRSFEKLLREGGQRLLLQRALGNQAGI